MDGFLRLGVWSLAVALGGLVCRSTRGITFFGTGTDNEKMVRAAALYRFRSWPSQMHSFPWSRAQLREVWVVALALVQRVIGDRTSDRANVVLALVANAVAAGLLYEVARGYWSTGAAVICAALFLTSFWPYQIAIFMGHVHLAHMFVLVAILLLQQVQNPGAASALVWYFASGVVFGLAFFASTASRKFVPLYAAAFFWSARQFFDAPWAPGTGWWARLARGDVDYGYLAVAVAAGLGVLAVRWLGRVAPGTLVARPEAISLLTRAGRVLALYAGALWLVAHGPTLAAAHAAVVSGFALVLLWLLLPDLSASLKRVGYWWGMSTWISHFQAYTDAFARRGITVSASTRGAGWPWIIRFFPRVLPFVSAAFLACLGYWGVMLASGRLSPTEALAALAIMLLSLSPVIIGEVTGSIQVGKAYFAAFTGLLIGIAATVHHAERVLGDRFTIVFWGGWALLIGVHAAWNAWVFIDDVWPARMAPRLLAGALEKLGVRRFHTYDTLYNDAFVNVVPPEVRERYEICHARSLAEVADGYVVVPGTSAKALNMETQRDAIRRGDFNDDPILTRLIETRQIEQYAVASFKTLGTSRFFVHESEITTYRDLILKDIDERDRWRGRAWILDVAKLRADAEGIAAASAAPVAGS